jgi:hypothetical protein
MTCKVPKDFKFEDIPAFVIHCNIAQKVLWVFEYIMILMAFYFFTLGCTILFVPLFKGYSSILETMAKNQLYFDLLPNLVVLAVFILGKLRYYLPKIAEMEVNQQFILRRR